MLKEGVQGDADVDAVVVVECGERSAGGFAGDVGPAEPDGEQAAEDRLLGQVLGFVVAAGVPDAGAITVERPDAGDLFAGVVGEGFLGLGLDLERGVGVLDGYEQHSGGSAEPQRRVLAVLA